MLSVVRLHVTFNAGTLSLCCTAASVAASVAASIAAAAAADVCTGVLLRRMDVPTAITIIRQVLHDTATEACPHMLAGESAATAARSGCKSMLENCGSGSSSSSALDGSSTTFNGAAITSTTTSSGDRGGNSSGSSGSSNGSNSTGDCSILLRAFVEVAAIQPGNGSLATLNQGYSVGAWTAALAAHGFDVSTVHVLTWKKDLGLIGRDKDWSRQLARDVFDKQAAAPQDALLRCVTVQQLGSLICSHFIRQGSSGNLATLC